MSSLSVGPFTPVTLAVSSGPSPLWYLTRATGLCSLVLLSASVVLGILQVSRWSSPRWPRFVLLGLHRNLSVMVLVLIGAHVVTAELDPFAPIGWLGAVVPLVSSYRPVWLGLGAFSFDLLLALLVSSLFRARIGYGAWKAVHWLAYACWPLAVVHGLGTGTDPRLGWVKWLTVSCVAVVMVAGAWRLVDGWPEGRTTRLVAAGTAVVSVLVVADWAQHGPLQRGWARKAGTPLSLLAPARPALGASPSAGARTAPSRPLAAGPRPAVTTTTVSLAESAASMSGHAAPAPNPAPPAASSQFVHRPVAVLASHRVEPTTATVVATTPAPTTAAPVASTSAPTGARRPPPTVATTGAPSPSSAPPATGARAPAAPAPRQSGHHQSGSATGGTSTGGDRDGHGQGEPQGRGGDD